MGHMVTAVNPISNNRVSLFIKDEHLEEQNVVEITKQLRSLVKLAKKDVVLYFLINERTLYK